MLHSGINSAAKFRVLEKDSNNQHETISSYCMLCHLIWNPSFCAFKSCVRFVIDVVRSSLKTLPQKSPASHPQNFPAKLSRKTLQQNSPASLLQNSTAKTLLQNSPAKLKLVILQLVTSQLVTQQNSPAPRNPANCAHTPHQEMN